MTGIGNLLFLAYFASAVLVWIRVDWSAGVFAVLTFLLVSTLVSFGQKVKRILDPETLSEDIAEAIVNVAKGEK